MAIRSRSACYRTSWLLSGILLSQWFPVLVRGDSYGPGATPTATVSYEATETVPTGRVRLDVGIQETIRVYITNWVDSDDKTVGSETNPENDLQHGEVSWSWLGDGSCAPLIGDETTFTAAESALNTSCDVTMKVKDDPNSQYTDAFITRTVTFQVKVPKGHVLPAEKFLDNPYYLENVGNSRIGGRTFFRPQHKPLHVSFKNVLFRENYPGATIIWPNGDSHTFYPDNPPFRVGVMNGMPNCWTTEDSRGTGVFPKAKIWNGAAYQNTTVALSVPVEFYANLGWHEFSDAPAFYKFYADLTAQASFDSTYGSKQGPYDN